MKNLKEDQEIFRAVEEEANRQALHIELIASEIGRASCRERV